MIQLLEFSKFPRDSFSIYTKAVLDTNARSILAFSQRIHFAHVGGCRGFSCKCCSQGQNYILLCKNSVIAWFIMQLLSLAQASASLLPLCAVKANFGYLHSLEVFSPPSAQTTIHSPELSLMRDFAHVGGSHLGKKALPASLGNEHPLPQQSHELLLGELPALHLVGAFPIHTTEKVCLSGFC